MKRNNLVAFFLATTFSLGVLADDQSIRESLISITEKAIDQKVDQGEAQKPNNLSIRESLISITEKVIDQKVDQEETLEPNDQTIREGLIAITEKALDPKVDCQEESLALSKKYSYRGANCTGFITPSGKMGPLGKMIIDHMNSMGTKALFFNKDLKGPKQICANWENLTKEQMAYFWVWLFAGISLKETTCGVHLINRKATDGVAVGHLQLNQARRDRVERDGTSGSSCGVADVKPHQANFACGIEILNEVLKGPDGYYGGNGSLFGRGAHTYWQDLRSPKSFVIHKLMVDFPPCK